MRVSFDLTLSNSDMINCYTKNQWSNVANSWSISGRVLLQYILVAMRELQTLNFKNMYGTYIMEWALKSSLNLHKPQLCCIGSCFFSVEILYHSRGTSGSRKHTTGVFRTYNPSQNFFRPFTKSSKVRLLWKI